MPVSIILHFGRWSPFSATLPTQIRHPATIVHSFRITPSVLELGDVWRGLKALLGNILRLFFITLTPALAF
jgi:hypothetical protein